MISKQLKNITMGIICYALAMYLLSITRTQINNMIDEGFKFE